MGDELAAKMEDLNVDVEEIDERLNPELQRDLCFAVLCERMDKRNYRWETYFDESSGQQRQRCVGWDYHHGKNETNTFRYDPKLAAEYILSGKEQFRAFMDFCKAVTTLRMLDDRLIFVFDKDVCMTQSDPFYEHFQTMFKSEECFFIQTLFKYIKCLKVGDDTYDCLESLFPHLSKMQNLEHLVIEGYYVDVDQLSRLLKVKQMKSIETTLETFELLDEVVTRYELESMAIIDDLIMEDAFLLSNFSPNELRLSTPSLRPWDIVSENKAFADTKKLTIYSEWQNQDSADSLCGQLNGLLLSADQFIGSVQQQMPKLKALVFVFSLKIDIQNLTDPVDRWKSFADLCSDFVTKYQGTFDVSLIFSSSELFVDRFDVHEYMYMTKQFSDQEYEVREYGVIKFIWLGHINLAKNVVLHYRVVSSATM